MAEKVKKKVVLAFAFGAPSNLYYNTVICQRALYLANELNIALITQEDISANIVKVKLSREPLPSLLVARHPQGHYLSALGVIVYGLERWCDEHHFPKSEVDVYIVTAPLLIKRCVRDLIKEGFEHIKTPFQNYPRTCWFDKNSTQPWTRSWWRWWLREIPLRLLPWWLYQKLSL